MKNLNKILGIIICTALIGISVNAQKEEFNETYVESIINNYINSSGINLTNYTLNIVPGAVPAGWAKQVNVFLSQGNSTRWSMKFRVDLKAGTVIDATNATGNLTDNETETSESDSEGNKTFKPLKLTGNETSKVEGIVNNYINSTGMNLTDYALRVTPRAVPAKGARFVNVFLFPENSTKWTMKFRVDLNSGTVIKELIKTAEAYGKSKQNKTNIKEALKIADNDSEIKKQFATLNFTKIPHVQSSGNVKVHIIFVPMNAYEKVKFGLEKKHNVTVIDVNISIEDKKIIRSEIKEIKEQLKENKNNGNKDSGENKTSGKPNKPESVDNETGGKHNDTNKTNGNKDSGGKSKDKD